MKAKHLTVFLAVCGLLQIAYSTGYHPTFPQSEPQGLKKEILERNAHIDELQTKLKNK